MGKLVRCISEDGTLTVMALDSTDIVAEAERIHQTSAVTSAALGRLLTAASMMGDQLKGADHSVTLRLNGGGPAGTVLAVADSRGNARGYVGEPIVELPLNAKGKLDVAGAVGVEGTLTVVKDLGMKEPYVGQIPLVSGEIAEDITQYFAASEQIPTVCALGVLVDTDHSCRAAGGILIQLLPFADEGTITKLERNAGALSRISRMIGNGMDNRAIADVALQGIPYDIFDELEVGYRCNCSRQRMDAVMASLGRAQVEKLLAEQVAEGKPEELEIVCRFCGNRYRYSRAELEKLPFSKA